MDLTSQRQQVARALKDLETGIAGLVTALAHSTATITLETGDGRSAMRRACEAYSAIDYEMEDEVGSSVVCLGVLGVAADIVKRAKAVNALKAEFKELCAPLHGIRIRIPVKGETGPTKAISAIRVILRNIQRSDLNLLAAYRKIPILDAPPATVTYTKANTRAVYRKTVEEIAEMLQHMNSPAAIADRDLLAALDRRVTHLALVKDRYENIRANVLYTRLDPRGRGRIQISAELPLLYATSRRSELLHVNFPSANAIHPKRERQAKLESEPYLRSLPVRRYHEA